MNFRQNPIPALIAPIFLGLSLSTPAIANDSDELEKLRALVQDLEQKVKIIDRKNELAEEAAAAKKKDTPVVKASEKGFSFNSADGKNEIKFRGIIQADQRNFFADSASDTRGRARNRAGYLDSDGFHDASDTALLRRVRPTIEGRIFDKYAFRFTPDFGNGNATVVDAYLDANLKPEFNIRAGKFKSFVGLERLQSAADLKFIERSYVTNAILPNRDLGVAVYGSLAGNKLDYAVGIVNGVVDGGNISSGAEYNGQREYTARLFATPFKDSVSSLQNLGFGLAGTYTRFQGEQNLNWTDTSTADATRNGLPSYLTEGQQTFFRYGSNVIADGDRWRISPQAYYYNGPFGVIAEYAAVNQDVSKLAKVGNTTANDPKGIVDGTNKGLRHKAIGIGLSYLLTGEDASFKGVKPKNDFDIDTGGWGAWELVARYSVLDIDNDTFKNSSGVYAAENQDAGRGSYADPTKSARRAQTYTAGINWYLNSNTKFALNYLFTKFDGGAHALGNPDDANPFTYTRAQVKDRPDEKALFARFQIAF